MVSSTNVVFPAPKLEEWADPSTLLYITRNGAILLLMQRNVYQGHEHYASDM